MKKHLLRISGVLAAVVLMFNLSVSSASALTESQIDAILNLMWAFGASESLILDTQASLRGEQTTSTTGSSDSNSGVYACQSLPRDLHYSSVGTLLTGNDVTILQKFLIERGFGNIKQINTFDSTTKDALAAYQSSVGISPAVGYFGPITRAHLASICNSNWGGGKDLPIKIDQIIDESNAYTYLLSSPVLSGSVRNQIRVECSAPSDYVAIKEPNICNGDWINWSSNSDQIKNLAVTVSKVNRPSSNVKLYARAFHTNGNVAYSGVKSLNASDISGEVSEDASIAVKGPSAGETWRVGETHRIEWDSNDVDTVRLYIYVTDVSGLGSGSTNYISQDIDNVGYYDWEVGGDGWFPQQDSLPHKYKIRVDQIVDGQSTNVRGHSGGIRIESSDSTANVSIGSDLTTFSADGTEKVDALVYDKYNISLDSPDGGTGWWEFSHTCTGIFHVVYPDNDSLHLCTNTINHSKSTWIPTDYRGKIDSSLYVRSAGENGGEIRIRAKWYDRSRVDQGNKVTMQFIYE
jgi:hypothetical protein